MKAEFIAIFAIYAGFALAEAISTGFFRKAGRRGRMRSSR